MAVVKNLMIRIGADFSGARKGMQDASRSLDKFKRGTEQTSRTITGKRGIGGISSEFRDLGKSISSSLSQVQGRKGLGGMVSSLKELRPALGAASTGLKGFGGAAGTAGVALGGTTLAVSAFVAILAVATVGVYQASQAAVKFEADLGRLNMALKGNSKSYLQWARAQGLAKSTSVELGATYGTLLSSFISDNKELANQTQQIVQTTRVVASATGRTIEDTLERMRSGLLGNTEAIEDLGIFVNVSMIESTKAFKEFANGKSWDQLDFRVQQQIRLAAILEQAYSRYGDKLQNNVMNKQTLLTEQLKDIKLHLSQAFLPIWDSVLPALTELASSLAYVTEQIARFTYWLNGWDYDERTQGTYEQVDAIKDEGKAYDDLGKSAKKARGELAAFDRLNLLGDPSSGGSGGGGGGSGGIPGGGGGHGTNPREVPDLITPPPGLAKKWRIEFDTPRPPDAGAGAVATAVINTINGLVLEANAKLAKMWSDLTSQTQIGVQQQGLLWNQLAGNLNAVILPTLSTSALNHWAQMWSNLSFQTQTGAIRQQTNWSNMGLVISTVTTTLAQNVMSGWNTFWGNLQARTAAGTLNVQTDWNNMLEQIRNKWANTQPALETRWSQFMTKIESLKTPLASVKTEWTNTLTNMLGELGISAPAMEIMWNLISGAMSGQIPILSLLKDSWSTTVSSLKTKAIEFLSPVITLINNLKSAWEGLKTAISGNAGVGASSAGLSALGPYAPKGSGSAASSSSGSMGIDWAAVSGASLVTTGSVVAANLGKIQAALQGLWSGASSTTSAIWGPVDTILRDAYEKMKQIERQMGIGNPGELPAFAKGGMVFGPTLAMVGDNPGARTDPEIIAPRSMFQEAIAGDNDRVIAMLQRIEQAIRGINEIQAVIGRDAIGKASVEYVNDERRRGRDPYTTT